MKKLLLTLGALGAMTCATAATIDGKALFQENCASCHGEAGKGGTEAVKGPNLIGDATKWSNKLFVRAVLEGKDDEGKALETAMPHWKEGSFKSDKGSKPSKAEVVAILKYLRTVK
jgi:mono/diheme cytochrome c family protein